MGGGGNGSMKRCQSAVTLPKEKQQALQEEQQQPTEQDFGELEPTRLYLSQDQQLYLPRRETAPCSLDVYLQSIKSVADRTEELFEQQQETRLSKVASSQKCLTVLQGEVAHASEQQTDLLVSAEATTCHIVALRSTHANSHGALASMAHVDQPDVYEECLEKMVQEHLQHHLEQAMEDDDYFFYDNLEDDDEEEDQESLCDDHHRKASFLPRTNFRRSQSMPTLPAEPVEMELHIAGGYLDEDGTSQGLSTSLVHSFSNLADKYQGRLKISLSTAAISSMNTTEAHGVRSRGLALNTHTGEVTPVTTALPASLEGPAMELRNARLWSERPEPELAVIHNAQSKGITIDPFRYQAQPQLDALLQVPDPVLLKVTSTSPQQESDRFCNDLRRTLSFVNTVPSQHVFKEQKPLVYSRSANALNEWEPVRH